MGDKEILMQLKIAYECLNDIIDNADNTQLKSVVELYEAQNIFSNKYTEIYKKIKTEDSSSLYYDTDLMISDCVSGDYITMDEENEHEYITAGDIGKRWWEDYGFVSSQ